MPSVTTYSLSNASPARTRADAVVIGIGTTSKGPQPLGEGAAVAKAWGRKWRGLLSSLGVKGQPGEAVKVPTGGTIASPLLVLVGLGDIDAVDPAAVRRAAGTGIRSVPNAASVSVALPADTPELVRAVTEGTILGGYRFEEYRSSADDAGAPGEVIVLSPVARRKEVTAAFDAARVVAEAVAGTRTWVNTPPGDLTPPEFADQVVGLVTQLGKGRGGAKVGVTVHDERALAELGCGGILGVGQGSSAPPRLVELTWQPKKPVAHIALVGKGITFDSGGLSIKPATGMKTMKMDMAGAATVVQATLAIARLGLPVRVSTFVPMAENMLSGEAMRPGDVLTIYGGRTVEVANTDAEGRLVLADALGRAAEVEPDAIVDVATLTGAMVLALGEKVAGVMGTDEVVDAVLAAGRDAGERLWPMPIPEEMGERVRSSRIADVAQHDWVRWGGGLFAAAFLREFTRERPWAHVDVAGPAYHSGSPEGHVTTGGTGFGVATLVDYARALGGR